MKKFLISLLIFILPCNSNFCFASDDFDYGIEKTEVNFFTIMVLPIHKLYDMLKNV